MAGNHGHAVVTRSFEVDVGEVGAAGADRSEERAERTDVEQGPRAPGDVVLAGRECGLRPLDRPARERLVAEHAAFRMRRGPGRVENKGGIAHADAAARRLDLGFVDALRHPVELQTTDEPGRFVSAQQHRAAQMRNLGQAEPAGVRRSGQRRQRAAQHLGEIRIAIVTGGGQDARELGVVDDVSDFRRPVPGIQRHDDATQHRRPEEGLDELHRVQAQQTDVFARLHTQRQQSAREVDGTFPQFSVGTARFRKDQRGALRVESRAAHQQVADRRCTAPIRKSFHQRCLPRRPVVSGRRISVRPMHAGPPVCIRCTDNAIVRPRSQHYG